jgi:hypothetical protein
MYTKLTSRLGFVGNQFFNLILIDSLFSVDQGGQETQNGFEW